MRHDGIEIIRHPSFFFRCLSYKPIYYRCDEHITDKFIRTGGPFPPPVLIRRRAPGNSISCDIPRTLECPSRKTRDGMDGQQSFIRLERLPHIFPGFFLFGDGIAEGLASQVE
ncbi:hypothetical protein SDC9_129140 [bioreactor metagenome]|uniref:Uncharacterized protein n=1 Tax=bioreactor metagenome TaxID=1076179 RepID=A0A645CZU3_9ZZZZ